MKNKKVIGLLLSLTLVLGLALPGTLATSTDVAGSNGEFSLGVTEEKTEPLGEHSFAKPSTWSASRLRNDFGISNGK